MKPLSIEDDLKHYSWELLRMKQEYLCGALSFCDYFERRFMVEKSFRSEVEGLLRKRIGKKSSR
ncbi:MAG: hypothetical protein QXO86_05165 [Nitrososphaerota archaeon]